MSLHLALSASLELVNTLAAVGSLLVFAAAAIAAVVQIRHLRASNELEALLSLSAQMRNSELQSALHYVQTELDRKLNDPDYRREISQLGFIDGRRHPEMDVCNWFNQVGTLVKNRLIDERTFLDLFSRLVTYYWTRLEGVIALLRRRRGPGQYENFEYLALLAARWQAKHPSGAYPAKLPRLPIQDVWKDIDEQAR